LDERPPDLVESSSRCCSEVREAIEVELLETSNDVLERLAFDLLVVRLETFSILRRRRKLGGRMIDYSNTDPLLLEPLLEVGVVLVVLFAEYEDCVDIVTAKEERFVGGDRGRDTAEFS
jgi:predicted HTH domain antitoxin